MILSIDNIEIYAARSYTNEICESRDEFYEDLERYKLARKLARKVFNRKSENIRLLCNHILCFTNNFELNAAKSMLMFNATEGEKKVIKTVLNYFGFIRKNDFPEIEYDIPTALLLKEMDR